MQKEIFVDGQKIYYILKHSVRSRGMRLSVGVGGAVVLTLPMWVSETVGEAFMQKKSKWLLTKVEEMKRYKNKTLIRSSAAEYKKKKEESRAFVHQRLEYWNKRYGFSYKDVRIKHTKTRWGSCSRRGNLNFHYKIIDLPLQLADYIVVHELCHLKELNHGPKFWKLVEKTIPDYSVRIRELRGDDLLVK